MISLGDSTCFEMENKSLLSYLCELQRKNPNFVSKFTFNPIFIHLFDKSNAVSLRGKREIDMC